MDKDDKNILKLFGINIKDDELTVDFKQAKETFKIIGEKLNKTGTKIKDDLKDGKIEIPTVGIDSKTKNVEIDLNKAKEVISSVVDRLSNLTEEIKKDDKDATLSFEINSSKCSGEEIAKILAIESNSKEVWRISSSKFQFNELKEISKKFIQFLTPKIDELKKIKKECKASLTLTLKLNSTPKEPITLSKEAIKFLNRVGGEFKFG